MIWVLNSYGIITYLLIIVFGVISVMFGIFGFTYFVIGKMIKWYFRMCNINVEEG